MCSRIDLNQMVCVKDVNTLVNMLSVYVQDPKKQHLWSDFITHVVFAYNTSIHSATRYTPYFLLYAREACIAVISYSDHVSPMH